MTLAAGTKLGPYEILSPLGAGGMGEVYRARDTKLAREVAIKVLPQAFAADREKLARFRREAQVLAALNHPHVGAIYGLEESGGVEALVLELVDGETLAEHLAAGPLPAEESLGIARQIAGALEAAHAAGVVHRDLKPANVKVTPSGRVKVLDFGLAKAFAPEAGPSPDLSHSPTVTSGGTQRGVVLGTAAYMSPEQARGKPLDRRTDVWSFACVLYEMLSGRRAFDGETISDVMVSVLSREPDWSALPATLPRRVRDLLRRCLQKDPDRRLHDVADARLEIDDAVAELGAAPAADAATFAAPARRRSVGPVVVAVLAAAGLAALATWRLVPRPSAAPAPRLDRLTRITAPTAHSAWPSWSLDGNLLAYASDRGGDFDIYVRRGDSGQDVDVTNDPGQDIQPAFSPDGSSIAFVSTRASKTGLIEIGGTLSRAKRTYGGDLWLVPSLGGPARRLAPDANFPAWRPDGRSVLYVSGPETHRAILEVSPEGGAPRAVLASRDSIWEIVRIASSPDGRWVSFEDQQEGVFLMPAHGGKPTRVASGFSHGWDTSSRHLWSLAKDPTGGTRVQSFDVDLDRGAVRGNLQTVGLFTAYLRDLAVSGDGRHLIIVEDETSRNLTRLPLAPGGGSPAGPEEPLSTGRVIDGYPQVSPDGGRVAYVSDTLGKTEVWILDLSTRRRQRLRLPGDDVAETQPAWISNGKDLVMVRYMPDGDNVGWIAALDGSRAEELIRARSHSLIQLRPSPDGSSLLLTEILGVQQLGVVDLESRQRRWLTASPGDKFDAEWSPDGRWIAVTASDGTTIQLYRMPSGGGPMQQLTTGYERMRHPFWTPDGKWVYIQPSHHNIYRVRAEGGPLEQVTRFPDAGLFIEEPNISPDGKYLVYCREYGGSSLWLLTLAGGEQK